MRSSPPRALALLLGVLAFLSSGCEEERETRRDTRYCEVIPLTFEGFDIHADVYNTVGFNDCPQEEWERLDEEAIAADLGTDLVLLNGPRYFIFDDGEIEVPEDAPTRTFGTLEMQWLATFTIPVSQADGEPYRETAVARDTTFVFFADRPVFELVSPEGETWVMQSYSLEEDPSLTLDQLPDVGGRIAPPDGWSWRTRTPEKDLQVSDVEGLARVVQDDLRNTYQFVP